MPSVGQIWRDDLEGKLWRIVVIVPAEYEPCPLERRQIYVRRADLHGAAARGQHSIQTHPSYFNGKYWELVDDAA